MKTQLAWLALLAVALLPVGAKSEEPSRARFADPPMEARPAAYWAWLNGNVDLTTLTSDLEQAKAKGMGGLEIWDVEAMSNSQMIPAGPAFLSDESVAAIRHALKEGQRLGMRVSMIASSGWNAGGAWVTPDWAIKHLYISSQVVTGAGPVDIALPFPHVPKECPMRPDGLPVFFQDVAVLAVPQSATKTIARPEDVLDLTARCREGRLKWTAPAGEWVVLRFVCSNSGQRLIAVSPNSNGLFIDFLEPTATVRHFRHILDRLGITPRNGPASGLLGLELDSMETGAGITWTDRFPEYFQRWCGYDPIRYLPILAGWKIEGATDAFRYDYRKAVSEQLIFSHYTTGRDFLRKYGLQLIAESGGPGPPIASGAGVPVDALKALGNVSVPRGEFWIRHRNMFLIKEIASAAHIYDLPLVDAESFTTWRRWMDGPLALKQLADRALCEGLNRFTFHTFAHSPPDTGLPGRAYHAGSDINPHATWWEQARPFIDYLARCSFMLQRGRFVADVCAYYGDQCPNFWPLYHSVPKKPLYPGLDPGYDYDVVNSDVILNRMRVRDGLIALPDGMSYKLLVLPNQDHIPAEVLEKIADLVKAGATILGPKPTRDPRLADQARRTARVRELAEALWGNDAHQTAKGRAVGAGKVFAGLTPTQVLAALGVPPDFRLASGGNGEPPSFEGCSWVWYPEGNPVHAAPPCTRFFRGELPLPADRPIKRALCRLTCDNDFTLFVNGRLACASDRDTDSWNRPVGMDITGLLKAGPNQLAVEAVNTGDKPNPAGLLGRFTVEFDDEGTQSACINKDWKTSNAGPAGWTDAGFDDDAWPSAMETAPFGQGPWGDLSAPGGEPEADFIHRRTDEADIYFVRNTGRNGGRMCCRFRVRGRQPELWDPVTGRTGGQLAFKEEAEGIAVELPLAPGGSAFVLFLKTGPAKPRFRLAQPTAEAPISGPWTLHFPAEWGVPPEVQVETLQSWTDFAEEGIRYFSGTAGYHKTLEISATQLAQGRRVYLDLGGVREVADVFLNGTSLGIVWQPPFRVDLTPAAKPGKNELKVEVTNLWINRLCGDMLSTGKRYTWTNQRAWTESIGGDEPWRAQPSGLLEVAVAGQATSLPEGKKVKELPVTVPGE